MNDFLVWNLQIDDIPFTKRKQRTKKITNTTPKILALADSFQFLWNAFFFLLNEFYILSP